MRAKGYEVLLTVHSTDDLQFYKELSKSLAVRIVSLDRLGIFGTARLYASADAVVTSRFHALILSAIFGKPVVSLYGAGKGGRLLSSGLPSLKDQSQDINAFNLKEFLDKISNCKPPARRRRREVYRRRCGDKGSSGARLGKQGVVLTLQTSKTTYRLLVSEYTK